jgi:hypothetical protein
MKFVERGRYSDPDDTARKLVEVAARERHLREVHRRWSGAVCLREAAN